MLSGDVNGDGHFVDVLAHGGGEKPVPEELSRSDIGPRGPRGRLGPRTGRPDRCGASRALRRRWGRIAGATLRDDDAPAILEEDLVHVAGVDQTEKCSIPRSRPLAIGGVDVEGDFPT